MLERLFLFFLGSCRRTSSSDVAGVETSGQRRSETAGDAESHLAEEAGAAGLHRQGNRIFVIPPLETQSNSFMLYQYSVLNHVPRGLSNAMR